MRIRVICCLLLVSLMIPHATGAHGDFTIQFQDAAVETVIREQLEMPEGPITPDDMLRIESFEYPVFAEGIIERSDAQAFAQITSISDLRHCQNLTSLDLFAQPIQSLDPLRQLQRLESISLVYCEGITSVEPLSVSPLLESIVLLHTCVSDFSPVLKLRGLKEFIATQYGRPPDLSPLYDTDNLETFFLRFLDAPIDYMPLANHSKMKRAELSYVDSDSLSLLVKNWPQLEMIDISSSSITSGDLNTLAACNLMRITLYDCPQIDDLSPLAKQTSLSSLTVNRCNVKDVSPLAGIPSLTHRIDLRDNPIDDLSPLAALAGLRYLVVSRNDDFYTLSGLRQLLPGTDIALH